MAVKLSEEARLKRNEYMRQWKKAHPDNVRATAMRYWERQVELAKQQELAHEQQSRGGAEDE